MKFLDKIMNAELEEKFFRKTIFITVIVIFLILIIVFLNMGVMRSYKIPANATTKNDNKEKVDFAIDNIVTGRKYIEIEGWAYRRGKNIGYFENNFIIKNENSKKYYRLNTDMTYRGEFFAVDEKYDCRRAGMYAKGLAIGLPKGLYQIFIEYKSDHENIVFDTGKVFKYGG